jgi:polysaccharide export outer membrane protein
MLFEGRMDSARIHVVLRAVLATSLLTVCASAQDQAVPVGITPATGQPAAVSTEKTETVTKSAQALAAQPADPSLRFGPGDLIEVGVYNVPELTSRARISINGDVYLPLIDYVHIGGLTSEEAQEVIEKKLSDGGFVKSPHVSIFVDQYASQGVSLLGEVARPGVYPVMGQQHLFDLISAAGGLSEKSGRSASVTHRNKPDKPETVSLSKNLSEYPQSNIEILPGDTVFVRTADIVYVVGDVAKPTGLLIDRGELTVLQALALAGGTTRTSRPNGARIIHKGAEGMSETPVKLKKILQAKAPDLTLKADDILFVPSSAFRTVVQDNATLAFQTASLGLVIVR